MRKVGRPTKYSEEILRKAEKYIELCHSEKCIPFIEELEWELAVDDSTIVVWSKEHDEFSAAVKRLKSLQKLRLMKDALEKKIQPASAIFLLKANHGLNERDPERTEPTIIVLRDLAKPKDDVPVP